MNANGARRPTVWRMALGALRDGGPGICHFSITNACNARCGFCSFAHDTLPAESRRWVALEDAKEACDILRRNGIQILHFNGGEPLVHRDLVAMVAHAARIGMRPALDTNGALLTERRIDALMDAGIAKVCISIDAATSAMHDANRGIHGLSRRIRRANALLKRRGISTTASVTMSRLVDYAALPEHLHDLGFGAVTFSYPMRTLPSSYLACREDSTLIDFTVEELNDAFETVKALSKRFPVQNPLASIEDMQRHLRGEPEMFGCLGGWKYFYLDWNLQLWRCHNWARPLCHIRDFDGSQRIHDGCTACMIDCYRDDSVMQHVGIALSDGLRAAAHGNLWQAWSHWADRRNMVSIRAAIRTGRLWARAPQEG
ncbi:MAG: radical SAM protein [Candidatus Rokuibacteriota bacterium]|nr:MAG: radical SAM protein [Candidatus Rokubacteria bacterium]